VTIRVQCRNSRGERGKKGREALAYACWCIGRKSPDRVRLTYRKRFGVETSYRQMNQCWI
ncbi:ISH3 family transposase, partial [Singulisphaera rosea]